MWYLMLFLLAFISICFILWWLSNNSFPNRFKSQGNPANKVSEKAIEQWKNKGLSGMEAGKAYNNGWNDPTSPQIVNGKIKIYSNYGQIDKNIDPTKVIKNQLDKYYKILLDIGLTTSLQLNLVGKISELNDWKLPVARKKKDLFIAWEECKYKIILERIREAKSIAEVEKENINVSGIEERKLLGARKKLDLVIAQNERKYEIILWNISQAKTILEVENETSNILGLEEEKLLSKKKKLDLFKVQNEQLNGFLNEQQKKVFNLAVTNKESLFFTGSAGTGKSFLLKRIISSLRLYHGEEDIAITATTGIAAEKIGGVTLNSFAGIRLGDSPIEDMIRMVKHSEQARRRWQVIKYLLIDEVSMLSGELFDKLELISRIMRDNSQDFGGLTLILSGDFFQLSPISGKYLFEALEWKNCVKHNIQLAKVHRQEEGKLIEILNKLRLGEISDEDSEFLRQLSRAPDYPDDGIKPTLLYATNEETKKINDSEIEKIPSSPFFYQAIDWENSSGRLKAFENSLIPSNLCLKFGAQVMLIKNLSENLVNGSQGVVIGFQKKNCEISQYVKRDDKNSKFSKKNYSFALPIVRFANGVEKIIEPTEWTVETPINRIVRASRQQIPLILSWAITIHKSQGQTIERLKVDCRKIFATGQLYVALSRATSIKYLQIVNFRKDRILCDEKVKDFYRNLS
jgi:DNA replication protein DnaC